MYVSVCACVMILPNNQNAKTTWMQKNEMTTTLLLLVA